MKFRISRKWLAVIGIILAAAGMLCIAYPAYAAILVSGILRSLLYGLQCALMFVL